MVRRIIPIVSVPLTGGAATVPPSQPPLGEQRLPRYTSYPPATEFTPLEPGVYVQWLTELPVSVPVSLYIHIPFCKQLCWFCGCFTRITQDYGRVREYVELVLREIAQLSRLHDRRLKVSHIHFGGGSPTILEPHDFTRLMDAIYLGFDVEPLVDVAIEVDPRTFDREKCEAFVYSGVNRVSLGVQDFSGQVQKAVNREQSYELVADVVAQLRHADIDQINFDLMYGLPYQTVESVIETARLAVALEPQRLAVFGYAHVPWMRKHQRVLDELPMGGPDERVRMFTAMRGVLIEHGYTPIGIDHYALKSDELSKALKAKTLRRNFQGYTTDSAQTLLGFGHSAISALPQGYAQNTSLAQEYSQAINEGVPAVARGLRLSPEDRMRRDLIFDLMCYYQVNLRHIADKYDWEESFFAEKTLLRDFEARGLVELDGDMLTLTAEGRPYVRAVCAIFDQYLQLSEHRYSLTV